MSIPGKVLYVVQPYFFAHNHIHRLKIDALRAAGIDAEVLSFIPPDLYRDHAVRYEDFQRRGLARAVPLRSANPGKQGRQILWYLLREVLRHRHVLAHVLRFDLAPFVRFRRLPWVGRRLGLVLEYEGDVSSEHEYVQLHNGAVSESRREEIGAECRRILAQETSLLQSVDGAVLISPEHVALWNDRLGRPLHAVAVPPLFENRFVFSSESRQRIRQELRLDDRFVLAYSGNVLCPWQRFGSACRLVSGLLGRGYPVHLLALVRGDDHELARTFIDRQGIAHATTLMWCPPDEVPGYLSAADFGLFLRKRHTMNIVTTSAKLGEYLACGLPLITTGNNAVYNGFIRDHEAGIFVDDSATIDANFEAGWNRLLTCSRDAVWRQHLSSKTHEFFLELHNPFRRYVGFIGDMLQGIGQGEHFHE